MPDTRTVTDTFIFDSGDKPVKCTDAGQGERLAEMYRKIGVRFTRLRGNVPICPQCKVRERSYAGEPGNEDSWSTWCYECFQIHAAAPWCFHPECSQTGTGNAAFTGEFAADGAALYLCPRAHFGPMSLVQHMAAAGVYSGERDAQAKLAGENTWLVDARMDRDGIGGAVTSSHSASRAYAQAYVAQALATLAGDLLR